MMRFDVCVTRCRRNVYDALLKGCAWGVEETGGLLCWACSCKDTQHAALLLTARPQALSTLNVFVVDATADPADGLVPS